MESEMIECSISWETLSLTAAYKVNNLVPVARQHRSGNPLGPGKYLEIALDGDAVRGQPEMREQSGYAEPRWDFARFSIYYNLDACGHFADSVGALCFRLDL